MANDYQLRKDATNFREKNGYNIKESIRLHSLLIKLGVLAVFKPLNENFSGMAMKAGDLNFMMVNTSHILAKQHFTICHELYHLFIQENFISMHCKTGLFDKRDKIEFKADSFAAYLLMPEEGILDLIPKKELKKNSISISTIVKIEQYYSCSRTAILFRLNDIGLIDIGEYEQYKVNVRQSARLLGYPESLYKCGNDGLIIGDYGEIAKNLYDDEKISESHYISLMHDIGVDVDNELSIDIKQNGEDC